MSAAALLVGAVLTFGSSDGKTLALTVSLTESATLAVQWGDVTKTSSTPRARHHFRGLPTPNTTPTTYRVRGPSGVILERTVKPIRPHGPLFVALYGDSRDGAGPHRRIAKAIADERPDVIVHTGDVVHSAGDTKGWVDHLTAALPMSASAPLVYALGNHELWQSWRLPPEQRIDAYAAVMAELPAPDDPIAAKHRVPPGVYHVRVGDAVFVALDSNQPIGPDTPQGDFLEQILEENEAKFSFVALHHGPLSSGRHGPSIASAYLMEVADRYDLTAFLAGHDHLYERIVRRGVTVIVSGGGGAPLYQRWRFEEGSRAFISTYHWVKMVLDGDKGTTEAFGLEGTLLDRATLPAPKKPKHGSRSKLGTAIAGVALMFVGLVFVSYRLVMHTG